MIAVCAVLFVFALPARAGFPDGRGRSGEERGVVPSREERQEHRHERQQLRDQLRDRQRDGLSPAGSFETSTDSRGRHMSPEERRQLRQEINNAGREVYGPARH